MVSSVFQTLASASGVGVGSKQHKKITTRAAAASSTSPRTNNDKLKAAFVAAAAAATLSLTTPAAQAGTPKGQGVMSTDEMGRTDVDRYETLCVLCVRSLHKNKNLSLDM